MNNVERTRIIMFSLSEGHLSTPLPHEAQSVSVLGEEVAFLITPNVYIYKLTHGVMVRSARIPVGNVSTEFASA